jgi:hypothetical protein
MLFTVANLPFDSLCFTLAVVSLSQFFHFITTDRNILEPKKNLETRWETGPKVFSRTVLNIFRSGFADSLGQCFLVGVGIDWVFISKQGVSLYYVKFKITLYPTIRLFAKLKPMRQSL